MPQDSLLTKQKDSTVEPQAEAASGVGKLVKVVGGQVQEIRGNAKWDTIKLIWQTYEKWWPYIVWGWLTLTALIAGLFQKLRGGPIDWLIIGRLAAFSVIPFLVAYLLYRRQLKRLQGAPTTKTVPASQAQPDQAEGLTGKVEEFEHDKAALQEQVNQQYIQITTLEDEKSALEAGMARASEQHRTEIGGLQHLAETHSIRATFRDREREALRWLYDIAADQAKDITSYVTITKITLGDIRIGITMPYVRFGNTNPKRLCFRQYSTADYHSQGR